MQAGKKSKEATVSAEDRKRVQALFPELKEFKDRHLAQQVVDLWVRLWRESGWDDLEDVPYLVETPGITLVAHIRFVARGSLLLGDLCAEMLGWSVDRDLLLATALLHDVSKPKEYEPVKGGCRKSEVGKKITHGVYGAAIAMQQGLSLDLVHLIHSHTPMAHVEPKRVEGWIVRAVDTAMIEGLLGKSIGQYVKNY